MVALIALKSIERLIVRSWSNQANLHFDTLTAINGAIAARNKVVLMRETKKQWQLSTYKANVNINHQNRHIDSSL